MVNDILSMFKLRPQMLITYRCNLKCPHCEVSCGPYRKEKLSLRVIKKFLEGITNRGATEVGISGGEPFCYTKGLDYILRSCKDFEISPHIISNGVGIKIETLKKYLNKIKEASGSISYSVDDFHMSCFNLREYTKSIVNTLKISFTYFDNIELKTTYIHRSRSYALEKILHNLAAELNLNKIERVDNSRLSLQFQDKRVQIFFQPLDPFGRAKATYKSDIKKYPSEYSKECPWTALTIDSIGTIRLCCHPSFEGNLFTFGNLNKDSWSDIESNIKLKKKLIKSPIEVCREMCREKRPSLLACKYSLACEFCYATSISTDTKGIPKELFE